jgi:Carboxypeptidase regulatory-like domain
LSFETVGGFVKCYSARFEQSSSNVEPCRIAVRIEARGGEIEGVVRDTSGRPIPNVHVATLPDVAYRGWRYSPVWIITKVNSETNEKGQYRLPRLYPGEYRLAFRHASFCDRFVDGSVAVRGEATQRDTVLYRGCIVTGIARVDGKPAAHVRVHIASRTVVVECITDADGRFTMPKSVPPGGLLGARRATREPTVRNHGAIPGFGKAAEGGG